MSSMTRIVALMGLTLFASGGTAKAQCTVDEVEKFFASDLNDLDVFATISLNPAGNLGLFGASGKRAAYVFEWDGEQWSERQTLQPQVDDSDSKYGLETVVLGGRTPFASTLFVAAPYGFVPRHPGIVYVYRFQGGAWVEVQQLRSSLSSDSETDKFGQSICVDHETRTVVIGAPRHDDSRGAAFIFKEQAGQWQETHVLEPSDTGVQWFGESVAIDGDEIGIGAPWHDDRRGAVYTFESVGADWNQVQQFSQSNLVKFDEFGSDVELDQGVLCTSASTKEIVYVYRKDSNGWQEETTLKGDSYAFGSNLDLQNDLLLVGAPLEWDRDDYAGAGHLYRDSGAGWVKVVTMHASDPKYDVKLGGQVCLTPRGALLARRRDDDRGTNAGALYRYEDVFFPLGPHAQRLDVGDTLTLTACGGLPRAPVQLFLVQDSGSRHIRRIAGGHFSSEGSCAWSFVVPPALAGRKLEFQAFGDMTTNRREWTSTALVKIQ